MKIVTVAEMQKIEKEANESGYTFSEMMERAGKGVAQIVDSVFTKGTEPTIIGLIGSGHNGGDTLIALEKLQSMGWNCLAYQVRIRLIADPLVMRVKEAGCSFMTLDNDVNFRVLDEWLGKAYVVLDGILGTGVSFPLKKDIAAVLKHLAKKFERPFIVAVDCPTGVNCDSGDLAKETLNADLTICLGAIKTGLLKMPAYEALGALETVDLGFDNNLQSWKEIAVSVVEDSVLNTLPPRPADAHKGTFGTLMVVAGSVNYTGAAYLSGKAAYRSGAGLVQMAIPSSLYTALAGSLPEVTWIMLPHEMGVISQDAAEILWKNLAHATAMVIGPGLGRENTTRDFLKNILDGQKSSNTRSAIGFITAEGKSRPTEKISLPALVLDADALTLLAGIPKWQKLIPQGSILTPHPGEMATLTGLTVEEIQANRTSVAIQFAGEWNCVVVLKGAFTVIAEPKGTCSVIPVATSALATAGTGDVLTGIIGGLLAQKMSAYQAACAGAYIHAQAGLIASDKIGSTRSVIAGDVLEAIKDIFRN